MKEGSAISAKSMPDPTDGRVLAAVKRMVARESRLSVDPADIADSEPLTGDLLRVTSFGLLGMLIRLEDELGVTLPDDLFAGQVMHTVADLAEVIGSACRSTSAAVEP